MNNDQYPRVFRPHGCNSFYVELQFQGERHRIRLGTLDEDIARSRAKERCDYVIRHGWKAHRLQFKPRNLSVGQYFELFEKARSDLKPTTFTQYRNSLNLAVSEINEFPDDPGKYGRKRSRRAGKRQKQIDAIELASLTPLRCEAWKVVSVAKRGLSTNSILRCLKTLFSGDTIAMLGIDLPDPLPFSTLTYEEQPPQKYSSNVNHRILLEQAKAELKDQDPEVFKAFLLIEFAGLKAGEIDRLEWKAFLWDQDILHIEGRQAANLRIEPDVKLQFLAFYRKATSAFVIESTRDLRPDLAYNYYRSKEVLDRLRKWLGAKGVSGKKLLETLRKEFGSQVCRMHGIYAASEAMRHRNIQTTVQCIANPVKVTTGLGHLL